MRSLNYIKSQIEFAAKGTGKITVNQNLIDAFNDVAEFINGKEHNTNFEDSLVLFYLMRVFKIDNELNKLSLSVNNELSNPHLVIDELFLSVKPKENVIDEIYTELKIHQLYNKIPKDKSLKKKDVRNLLDDLLKDAKSFKSFEILKSKKMSYGR